LFIIPVSCVLCR